MATHNMLALVLLSFQVTPSFSDVNVYDKPMTDCGSNHADGCTYVAYDAGAHEVCVTQLPKGFSSETGQGPWSDQFTGQPWCICIWAYSNYILQNKDLALKCESIPSKVLEEQYSLDKFEQCGKMSSKQGCGAEDIRRSIQSLCQQCDAQAADQPSKTALKAKCDKILAAAPEAPMSRLFARVDSVPSVLSESQGGIASPNYTPALGFAALAAAVGMVVMVASKLRSRYSQGAPTWNDDNLESFAEVAE